MKASNGRDATPAQHLEHLRLRRGIDHARQIRDQLGWRWSVRHSWVAWLVATCSAVAAVVRFLVDLKELVGYGYTKIEERVGTIDHGRGTKGDRVCAKIFKRNLPSSISESEGACPGIGRDMVRVILRAMKSEGLINPTGKHQSAKWGKIRSSSGQFVTAPSNSSGKSS